MKLPQRFGMLFMGQGSLIRFTKQCFSSPTCWIVDKGLVKLGNIPMYRVSTLDLDRQIMFVHYQSFDVWKNITQVCMCTLLPFHIRMLLKLASGSHARILRSKIVTCSLAGEAGSMCSWCCLAKNFHSATTNSNQPCNLNTSSKECNHYIIRWFSTYRKTCQALFCTWLGYGG